MTFRVVLVEPATDALGQTCVVVGHVGRAAIAGPYGAETALVVVAEVGGHTRHRGAGSVARVVVRVGLVRTGRTAAVELLGEELVLGVIAVEAVGGGGAVELGDPRSVANYLPTSEIIVSAIVPVKVTSQTPKVIVRPTRPSDGSLRP